MTAKKDLPARMRQLADTGHGRADELRDKADALDAAITGFYGNPQTIHVQKFVGSWARARRLWCECTGEPLV